MKLFILTLTLYVISTNNVNATRVRWSGSSLGGGTCTWTCTNSAGQHVVGLSETLANKRECKETAKASCSAQNFQLDKFEFKAKELAGSK